MAEQFESLLSEITTHSLSDHFAGVEYVRPHDSHDLQPRLEEKSREVRGNSMAAGLVFSVQHMNALFERFFESAGSTAGPSLIQAARKDFPVKRDMWQHISNFLGALTYAQDLSNLGAEVVASSILLDNYTPEMHRKNVEATTKLG